jgi:UDPglucose--hexose-1-phosphate uridylyltransferase
MNFNFIRVIRPYSYIRVGFSEAMLNEFRQDLVSGEWVLFSTGRRSRPGETREVRRFLQPRESCPFEDPEKSGNKVVETYFNKDKTDWFVKIIKNKFPAVAEGEAGDARLAGPFKTIEGRGMHEVAVFRDHERDFYDFSDGEIAEIFRIYRKRYLAMMDSGSRKYTLIFHNHGVQAGATVSHPHSQIISIPVLPPDVKRSIDGSEDFYRRHGEKIYDVMLEWEMKEKKRIVYENGSFVAFCPFVSKTEYEVRIFPKESQARFEKMPEELFADLGDVFRVIFRKIGRALDKPDYNFFIHTSPINLPAQEDHEFYSWHIEILLKMATVGAFELASGMEINVIDPDGAAKLFRETKI